MIACDALIVGGGPAGSTCARALRTAGWNVVVIDRARFPRDKVCGGWVTPEVFDLLELDPVGYRDAGLTLQEISGFRTGVLGSQSVTTPYRRVVSYAIRRCEFDAFLLRRSEARVLEDTPLISLRRHDEVWIANEEIAAPIVIGAGGHFCPVARHLRGAAAAARPVVAKEAEFRLDGRGTTVDAMVPELFFCHDLEGYGWCVRKGHYLNVGLGRRTNVHFNDHVRQFSDFLERSGKAPGASRVTWRGHAYLTSGVGARPVVDEGLLLVGDAAGVAYPESGEGIRPAIESAVLAARSLTAAAESRRRDDLLPYQASIAHLHPQSVPVPALQRAVMTMAGRALLRSRWFTRHLVLDRWFLRRSA